MNVLNRKLFRNKDARRALSEMGGIVSFANGGATEVNYLGIPYRFANNEFTLVDSPLSDPIGPESGLYQDLLKLVAAEKLKDSNPIASRNIKTFLERGPSLEQDIANDTVTVVLDPNSTLMKPFKFNPTTGEVIPIGQLSEFFYNSSDPNQQRAIQERIFQQYSMDQRLNPSDISQAQKSYEMDPTSQTLENLAKLLQQQRKQAANPIDRPNEEFLVTSQTASALDPKESVFAADGPEVAGTMSREQLLKLSEQAQRMREEAAQREDAQKRLAEEQEKLSAEKFLEVNVPKGDPLARGNAPVSPPVDEIQTIDEDQQVARTTLLKGVAEQYEQYGQGRKQFDNLVDMIGKKTKEKKPKSLKELVAAEKEIFAEILGVKRDKKEQMYETMALMGFLMMAGESPNALTNAGNAAVQVLGLRREDRLADEAADREIGMLALESVLGRESVTQEAELKKQEMATKYFYDLALATANKEDKVFFNDKPIKGDKVFDLQTYVIQPNAAGRARGMESYIEAGTVPSITTAYNNKMVDLERHLGMVDRARNILINDDVAGLKGFLGSAKDSLRGILGEPFVKRYFGDELSGATKYKKIMRILAAELAPALLGESGRTISDGDRARVAQILGFQVTEVEEKGRKAFRIGEFEETVFTSDEELLATLKELDDALAVSGRNYNSQYEGYLSRVKKLNPDTGRFESIEFTTPSEKKSGEAEPSSLLIQLTEEDIKAYS